MRSRQSRRHFLHAALLAYTALALAWTALGPLPWMILPAPHGPHEHHHHAASGPHHTGHLDPSELPGSPLHPDDHGCAACQLLQHLSRGAPLTPIALASAPVQEVALTVVTLANEVPPSTRSVALPHVRGPPTHAA
ncbi:MAG TPA: hypothetical protein VFB54_13870 [Burkholderiales bacterium]|nr:hypothetical protein [Burkholderiales bacterium]